MRSTSGCKLSNKIDAFIVCKCYYSHAANRKQAFQPYDGLKPSGDWVASLLNST